MNIAAIIVGIDNWQRFTKPLIDSLHRGEPLCTVVVIDNASTEPYPSDPLSLASAGNLAVWRTERLCYSAAINKGKAVLDKLGKFDWYIVLSNDVLCTGPFAHILEGYDGNDLVGPLLLETPIPGMGMVPYIEGWCMIFSRQIWEAIGGFDENYIMSSFEDVDVSHEARKAGFGLLEDKELPFTHLDQKQRFYLPGYGGSEEHNIRHFMRKNGVNV